VWYRTHIKLSAAEARSANRLDLGAINQVDQTWINGRVVGNTFGYGTDRTYNMAPGLLHAGDNVLVINVLCNYGGGGLLEGGARRALRLADGRSIPLEGGWEYQIAPTAMGYPPRAPWESVGGLTSLYNAMIAPLGHYVFRGALWYQGESNTGEADGYQALLAGLMADWRHQFGAGLPFLVVQLPNYGKLSSAPQESGWAELREAQRQAVAKDAHAGLAVTIDIGDAHNLHPTNKQDVGRRLALAARHVIYGESIAPSGPVGLGAVRAEGALRADRAEGAEGGVRVIVGFGDVADHLVTVSHDTPIGFELCGDAPQTCQFAQARLDGKRVMLESRNLAAATRVRYCWADSPICTLFDASGLPAGPFEMRISERGALQDAASFDPGGTAYLRRNRYSHQNKQ
jgi:sialate O-acetylesterase